MIKELFLVKSTRVHGLAVYRNTRETTDSLKILHKTLLALWTGKVFFFPASLIVREVPWFIITYFAAENEMVRRRGDKCEDRWPTSSENTSPCCLLPGPQLCPLSATFLAPVAAL